MRAPVGCPRLLLVLALVISAVPCTLSCALGAEVALGLQLGAGARDVLSVTDVRPASRGESIAGADVRLSSEHWAWGLAGRLGASWFDFRQPFGYPSGNIKDQSWSVQPSVDRLIPVGADNQWLVGLGMEYGEWRSWTDTRLYSARGPHAFFAGGVLRLGLLHRCRRVNFHGEVTESIFRAHAADGATVSEYHWLGRSLSIAVGARYVLWGGSQSGARD